MIIGIWRYCIGIKSWINLILFILLPFILLICKFSYDLIKEKQNKIEKYSQEQRELTQDYKILNNEKNIEFLLQLAQEKSLFNEQENYQDAEAYLTEKFNLKQGELNNLLKENESRKDDLLRAALSYFISDDYNSSLLYFNKLLEDSNDPKKRVMAYSFKGEILLRILKLDESKKNSLDALEIFSNNNELLKNRVYAFELGRIYGNLGVIAKRENNLESAVFYYSKELHLFESLNEQFYRQYDFQMAKAHQKIYALYSGLNQSEKGYSNLIKAEKLLKGINHFKSGLFIDYANVLNSLGLYHVNKNAFDKADSFFLKALNVLPKINNEKERLRLQALTYSNVSQKEVNQFNLNKSHNLKQALNYSRKAKKVYLELKIYEDDNIEFQFGQSLGNLANILRYMGKYEESERTYKEVLVLRKKIAEKAPGFSSIKLADGYISYAMFLYDDLKKFDEAKEYAQKAILLYTPYIEVDPSLKHWINIANNIISNNN